MDATVYVRPPNSYEYSKLGVVKFSLLPRVDEYFSAEHDGANKVFQVVAVHHHTDKVGVIDIYAVNAEPPWTVKKSRMIGFGS